MVAIIVVRPSVMVADTIIVSIEHKHQYVFQEAAPQKSQSLPKKNVKSHRCYSVFRCSKQLVEIIFKSEDINNGI